MKTQFTNDELRQQGRCPLTPEEIGLLLRALGFNNNTRLYLASHKVYGGEARISTLRKLFPLMEDKKSLASNQERAQVEKKTSLLAAMSVCSQTSSFLLPQEICTMQWYVYALPQSSHLSKIGATSLPLGVEATVCPNLTLPKPYNHVRNYQLGYRAYRNMKTIRPNMVLLSQLFLNETIEWPEFQQAVENGHSNRQGQIRFRKETQSIYTYPIPDCMCQQR